MSRFDLIILAGLFLIILHLSKEAPTGSPHQPENLVMLRITEFLKHLSCAIHQSDGNLCENFPVHREWYQFQYEKIELEDVADLIGPVLLDYRYDRKLVDGVKFNFESLKLLTLDDEEIPAPEYVIIGDKVILAKMLDHGFDELNNVAKTMGSMYSYGFRPLLPFF